MMIFQELDLKKHTAIKFDLKFQVLPEMHLSDNGIQYDIVLEMLNISHFDMSLKIITLRLQQHLPGRMSKNSLYPSEIWRASQGNSAPEVEYSHVNSLAPGRFESNFR